jgi:hypothetical protein
MTNVEDRADRIRALIELEPATSEDPVGTALVLNRLCRVAARLLPAQGVAVSLMTEHGPSGIVAMLDKESGAVEELQFLIGEGPGWDAFEARTPVQAPDLQTAGAHRWPGYSAAAGAYGIRAAFAFPLFIGSARLGVLGIYRAGCRTRRTKSLSRSLVWRPSRCSTARRRPATEAPLRESMACCSHDFPYTRRKGW